MIRSYKWFNFSRKNFPSLFIWCRWGKALSLSTSKLISDKCISLHWLMYESSPCLFRIRRLSWFDFQCLSCSSELAILTWIYEFMWMYFYEPLILNLQSFLHFLFSYLSQHQNKSSHCKFSTMTSFKNLWFLQSFFHKTQSKNSVCFGLLAQKLDCLKSIAFIKSHHCTFWNCISIRFNLQVSWLKYLVVTLF